MGIDPSADTTSVDNNLRVPLLRNSLVCARTVIIYDANLWMLYSVQCTLYILQRLIYAANRL